MGAALAIVDSALELSGLGFSVFPLTARGKKPIVESWAPYQEDRAPPDVVLKWWRDYPDANIAIACGPVSGVFVLDVDGDVGREALKALQAKHEALPQTWHSLTGKGEHYWFAYPDGRVIGNSAKRLGAGLDTRGHGGYVVGPGSVHENGTEYRWGVPPGAAELAECPAWLLAIIDPPPGPVRLAVDNEAAATDAYVQRALNEECGAVLRAPEGERNNTLNKAAFSLGQLVGGGVISERVVSHMLLNAALGARLPEKESVATIASGMTKGALQPRSIPQREPPRQKQAPRSNGSGSPAANHSDEPPPTAPPLGVIRLTSAGSITLDNGPPYVCKGLIHRGDMSVLYGQSGCGKTFLALYLAHAIATGRQIFERRVKASPVALFALEGSSGLSKRLVAIQGRYGPAADLYIHRTPLTLFQNMAILLEMIEAVKAVGAGLVIFDTLSRTMAGANENAPEDMTAMVGMFDILRARTGAHVMLVHHSGKNEALGARGHSSLRAAVEVEMEVAANESGPRTMTVTKGRDDADGKVVAFNLEPIVLGQDDDGDDIETCIVDEIDKPAANKAPRAPKLNAFQAIFLKDLNSLPDDWVVPEHGMPNVRAVNRDNLVAELKRKGRLEAGAGMPMTGKDRAKVLYTLQALEQKGLVCSNEKWVWKI